MPKGKILMGKRPKPPVDRLKNSDAQKGYGPMKKDRQKKANPAAAKNEKKATSYNVKTYGEAKPVDERGFGRVSLRATAPVKGKARGGPGQNRTRLTPQQINQLQKNKQAVGAGKNKPAPGKGNPKKPIPMPRAIEPGGKTPARIAITTPEQMKQKRATGLNALRKTKPVMPPRRGGR